MKRNRILLFLLLLNVFAFVQASDSILQQKQHISVELGAQAGNVLNFDNEVKSLLIKTKEQLFHGAVFFQGNPKDSSRYDVIYNYPSVGIAFGIMNGQRVVMHSEENEASYDSKLGNLYTLYGIFRRRLFYVNNFSVDYSIENGLSYNSKYYNPKTNIDNRLIGSWYSIYIGFAAYLNYRLGDMEIGMGPHFSHYSNGGTARPNKGANLFGLSMNARYYFYDEPKIYSKVRYSAWKPEWYFNLSFGVGVKALVSAYEKEHSLPPSDRTITTLPVYPSYNFSTDFMCRYNYRYRAGIGLDFFYAPCTDEMEKIEKSEGLNGKYNRWEVAISAKHEACYKNWAITVGLGTYLLHRAGYWGEHYEKPYYEFLGLKYRIPKFEQFYVAYQVKAHLGKADQMELRVGMEVPTHKSRNEK